MNPTQQSEVNIVEVCEAALSAAQAELKLIEENLEASIAAWTENEAAHRETVKKLQRTKQEIEDTISKVTELGVDAPADLKAKAASLDTELTTVEEDYESSPKYLELRETKNQLVKSRDDAQAKLTSWTEKTKVAKYLGSQFEKGKDHGLGLSKVQSFKTMAEAKAKYFTQVPIVLHVQADGWISEASYWSNCASKGCLASAINEQPRYIVQDIPKSLKWVKELKAYKAMHSEGDRSLTQIDGVYLVRVESKTEIEGTVTEDQDEERMQEMIAKWDNQLLTHECTLYRKCFFFVESDQEFFGIWAKSIKDGDIKYQRRSNGYGYHDTTYTVVENEREFDASKLFQDFKEHNTWSEESVPVEITSRRDGAIRQFATTTPVFEPRNKRLTMDLIEKEVGMYWKAFIASPWASEIVGPAVIMLKHLCERGIETPHIWTLEHKGHYGFRVRTRDHSWIVGRIYCPPSALSRTTPIDEEVVYLPTGRIVKVGEAAIYVAGFQKDDR